MLSLWELRRRRRRSWDSVVDIAATKLATESDMDCHMYWDSCTGEGFGFPKMATGTGIIHVVDGLSHDRIRYYSVVLV